MTKIAADAVVADVVGTLIKAEDYVIRIVQELMACKSKNGSARVRIGITGEGKVPAFKILYLDEAGSEVLYKVYDGYGNGTAFAGLHIQEGTWSGDFSELKEVQNVLGDIRGRKR